MKIDVLDKGFIQLMRCADSDLDVVNCARVSFGKESDWEPAFKDDCPECCGSGESIQWDYHMKKDFKGMCDCHIHYNPSKGYTHNKKLSDRDTKLIHYLARENHWSPFAHPQIRLRVKAPIFIRTQLFKHKQGLVENEVSRRYVDDEPEFYIPSKWRKRPEDGIKQGSSDELVDFYFNHEAYLAVYNRALETGIAPEQARSVLPQSTYTEWIWTGSLAAFVRIYKQRSDPHAQWEAQQYAHALAEIIEPLFPVSWKALTNG